jgi:RNA recognition motif-containing protein
MSRNLYIGGLSYCTTENSLFDLFSQAGQVIDVKMIVDQHSGRMRGFAFVEMATNEESNSAIEQFDGYNLDGRNIVVNFARDKRTQSHNSYHGSNVPENRYSAYKKDRNRW